MKDKNINRWHESVTPSSKAPQPWTVKSGGSWDMLDVQPVSDEMLAELARKYNSHGCPWNCRSLPLADSDREYMYLLYYCMQGLIARMRAAEKREHESAELRRAAPPLPSVDQGAVPSGWLATAISLAESYGYASEARAQDGHYSSATGKHHTDAWIALEAHLKLAAPQPSGEPE